MKQLLIKLASFIAKHYAATCVYEAKQAGQCLCKYCENAACPNKRINKDLEVIQNEVRD